MNRPGIDVKYFCTLFDGNYFFKGLSLIRSLMENCREAYLFVLCMDDATFDILRKLDIPSVHLLKLKEFEDQELLKIKSGRSVAEYCWTLTPSLPLYILGNFKHVDFITYLDADLCFYSSLEPIFEEIGDQSIAIIEHRFIDRLKHLSVNGIYNVEWVSFRRDASGMACLKWWRERCNEWCFNRLEDGKMGDQKYLDDWTERFTGVVVLQHPGAGVAPWNFSKYEIRNSAAGITIDGAPLIFYHFHQFRIFTQNKYYFMSGIYTEEKPAPALIYDAYIAQIEKSIVEARSVLPGFKRGVEPFAPIYLEGLARRFLPTGVKNILKRL